MTRRFLLLTLVVFAAVFVGIPVFAEDAAPTLTIPEGAQAGPDFDVLRATEAWVFLGHLFCLISRDSRGGRDAKAR